MKMFRVLPIVASVSLLIACGGDDSSQDPKVTYSGTLIVPQGLQQNSLRILAGDFLSSRSDECPNVPDGYLPMANAAVVLEDENGSALSTETSTDNCGVFTVEVAGETDGFSNSVISATLDGYKPLKANAENFISSGDGAAVPVASTVSSDAKYIISAIQSLGGDKISFSVTDSASNNAVIQLTKNAFEVSVNDQPLVISALNSTDQLGLASSNVVALDASGSMTSLVTGEDELGPQSNNEVYTRHRLTAKAAHQFVSEKGAADEFSVISFDNQINTINNAFIANYNLLDETGNSVNFDYPETGFVQDKAKLHFAIDMYNPKSSLWQGGSADDEKHPDRTDTVATVNGFYPWSGGTELEGAINTSLEQVKERTNTLKRVFVLTDGQSYFNDRDGVIALANENSIPVHAIAISQSADEENLQEIATQTGGTYYKVIDEQTITGIYSSLQTTIKYAYVAELNAPLQSSDTLKLTLTINGEEVERTLTIQ
ncbi:VWA domain-containing protein [Vibrio sinensis]|uniref:VWA domain-containing protein n=1 Tax=Vibrio sinensis TaxID=2302434 RepID=A0A3A6QYR8_9VIBR|nr:vWA domain-containing protein [Vibrio sinensis]RJX68347.1 VWA domain-containing protein [Vibrio sinensis]